MSAELIRASRDCVGAGSCESTHDSEAHTLEHLWDRGLLSLISRRREPETMEAKKVVEAGGKVINYWQ